MEKLQKLLNCNEKKKGKIGNEKDCKRIVARKEVKS
jgi:hypothetical protein